MYVTCQYINISMAGQYIYILCRVNNTCIVLYNESNSSKLPVKRVIISITIIILLVFPYCYHYYQ